MNSDGLMVNAFGYPLSYEQDPATGEEILYDPTEIEVCPFRKKNSGVKY